MSWDNMSKKKSSGGLGFRCVRDFNLALIGKQSWRLITHPDMLVSRIFKARYYPDNSFLSAKLGANPSYIWRSILETQPLLKQGLACRVGNGVSVFVLNEPWLPDTGDPYVRTTIDALQNIRVSSLLYPPENQWNRDLILSLFEERDADLILAIPVNATEKDSWYWKFEKLGTYSVKSAYGHIREMKENNRSEDNSGFWKQLWNLKIPTKIKHFMWRALSGNLPTKDNLRNKRVEVDAWCPVCQRDAETTVHTLLTCTFSEECWKLSGIPKVTGQFQTFAEWFQLLLHKYRRNEIHLAAVICWMIWKNRNDLVWNQRSLGEREVVESAKSVLDQWKCVQDNSFDFFLGYMTPEDGHEHWQLPQNNRIKVNTDAAIFKHSSCYSHAFVARNQHGHLIEAQSKCRQGAIAPELAEALGIREALSWIKENQYDGVELETDCLQVIQAIRSTITSLSYLGRVVEDCRVLLLSLKARNVIIRFVKRSANRVSHFLARYSCSISDRGTAVLYLIERGGWGMSIPSSRMYF